MIQQNVTLNLKIHFKNNLLQKKNQCTNHFIILTNKLPQSKPPVNTFSKNFFKILFQHPYPKHQLFVQHF